MKEWVKYSREAQRHCLFSYVCGSNAFLGEIIVSLMSYVIFFIFYQGRRLSHGKVSTTLNCMQYNQKVRNKIVASCLIPKFIRCLYCVSYYRTFGSL